MQSLPEAFLAQIAQDYSLTEFETETFIARLSGMDKTDIVIAQALNISRDRFSSRMTGVYKKFRIDGAGPNKAQRLFIKLLNLYEQRQPSGSAVTQHALELILDSVRKKLQPAIQERCGSMRVLDMDCPIEIAEIYTEVTILNRVAAKRHVSKLSELLEEFDSDLGALDSTGFAKAKGKQFPGAKVVQKYPKLVILGKPGAGKTTFLKHLSMQCIQESLFPHLLPIFVTLRYFAENPGRAGLLDYLCESFKAFEVDRDEIVALLKHGKAIVFLDGLDEVADPDVSDVLTQIQSFSNLYHQNRFIVTCRLAAQDYAFQGFTEVEIADFNDQQIAAFAHNWFTASEQPAKAGAFLSKLAQHSRIRELATSPLLLTLLCLVFGDSLDFPSNRAELYEEGLDVLLKKWDARRNIERCQAYRKLSRQRKEDLLSQIAHVTFRGGRYFFKQRLAEGYIKDYISNLPDTGDDPNVLELDSRGILKSIESQHGLLVERARKIYSFSHLTFHEYFAARKIATSFDPRRQQALLTELVSHCTEPRWQEVCLLVAGMLPNADYLLQMIKAHLDALVADADLERFFDWLAGRAAVAQLPAADEPAVDRPPPCPAETCAAYCYLALMDWGIPFLEQCAEANSAPDFQTDLALTLALNIATGLHADSQQLAALTDVSRAGKQRDRLGEGHSKVRSNLALALQHGAEAGLQVKLQDCLRSALAELPQEPQAMVSWWTGGGSAWIDRLKGALIRQRDIGHGWQFTDAQALRLKQYLNGSRLLLEILNADCYISRDKRQLLLMQWLIPSHQSSGEGNGAELS
ncbi:MAG: NACHT domain-containing protein [Elainellaceae cyanobacterium]